MTAPVDELDENLAYVIERNAIMNPVPPKQPPKRPRNLRVEDPLWARAEVKAGELGISVSEYIRGLIDRDTHGDE